MYTKKIIDLFKNARNIGIIKNASGMGYFCSEISHDKIKLFLKIESGRVINATFKTYSNILGIACLSVLTDILKSKTVEDAKEISFEDLLQVLGDIKVETYYVLDECLSALQLAITDYEKKLEK